MSCGFDFDEIFEYFLAGLQYLCLPIIFAFQGLFWLIYLPTSSTVKIKLIHFLKRYPNDFCFILVGFYLALCDLLKLCYMILPFAGIGWLMYWISTLNFTFGIKLLIEVALAIFVVLMFIPHDLGLQGAYATIINLLGFDEIEPDFVLLKSNSDEKLDLYYYLVFTKRIKQIFENNYDHDNIKQARSILFASIKPDKFALKYLKYFMYNNSKYPNLFNRQLTKEDLSDFLLSFYVDDFKELQNQRTIDLFKKLEIKNYQWLNC